MTSKPIFPIFICLTIGIYYDSVCAKAASIDKSKAVGPCVNRAGAVSINDERCPPGHYCVEEECYPKKFYDDLDRKPQNLKLAKNTKNIIGPCVNSLCPASYECINNSCHKRKNYTEVDKEPSIGPCINDLCPDGYTCNKAEYKCLRN